MVALFGVFIPIIAVGGFFAWMIALSPVGKAYAERLRGPAGGMTPEASEQVLQALEDLRVEMTELAERVDFIERKALEPPR